MGMSNALNDVLRRFDVNKMTNDDLNYVKEQIFSTTVSKMIDEITKTNKPLSQIHKDFVKYHLQNTLKQHKP
jgi:hypothetical protein